jgi:hemerythrin-like domain-containing protein
MTCTQEYDEVVMQTTETLRAEHEGVLVVLEQLERAVAAAERGALVPGDIFRDVQEFFTVFVDRCHHGKEETELFPQLATRGSGALVERLEGDHALGRQLAAGYGQAVDAYTPGDPAAAAQLAATARHYAAFLREHIDLETRQLLPAVESTLADHDQALNEAFERIEVERIGAGTHERLHEMIEGLGQRIDPYVGSAGPRGSSPPEPT